MLSQLPIHINDYPPNEKELLEDFFTVINAYQVDTQTSRANFSLKVENFIKNYRPTNIYLQFPFMWFAIQFLENANRLLPTATFFAEEFYEYIVDHFRGISGSRGLFHLIREKTPLNDMEWEKLQYALAKFRTPLNSEQYQIVNLIISTLPKGKIYNLNKELFSEYIRRNSHIKHRRLDLKRFFTLIDARWMLQFNLRSLGTKRAICKFQLEGEITINDFIDFTDPKKYIIRASQIYQIRKTSNMFIGILIFPEGFDTQLMNHLNKLVEERKILLLEYSIIKESLRATSFVHYKENKGWESITATRKKQLVKRLETKSPRKRGEISQKLFSAEKISSSLRYQQTDSLIEIISLFCKLNEYFSFENLPIGLKLEDGNSFLTKREERLLSILLENKNIVINFFSNQLRIDFSLDEYWIKIPLMPIWQLSHLLEWLPYSSIDMTDDHIHLRSVLTPNLVDIIQDHLLWEIFPLIEEYHPIKVEMSWFNELKNKWKNPEMKVK